MGNRVIDSREIQHQTGTLITSLQNNNEALQAIISTIEDFVFEQKLSGEAWEKGKRYMKEGHCSVIQGLICGNEALISDIRQYTTLVGNGMLDEGVLNDKIETLEEHIRIYRREIRDAEERVYTRYSIGAQYAIPVYYTYIKGCESLIHIYETKIYKIQEIEYAGRMLFDQANGLYTTVQSAIEGLGKSWDETTSNFNLSVLNGSWKKELDSSYSASLLERFLVRDESGEVTGYNYDAVYRILRKDPERITDREYAVIAYVLVMEEDIKNKQGLINACYDSEELSKDSVKPIISTRTVKLNKILEKVSVLESGIYAGVNALKTEEERKAVCATGILGKVQQSKVLLEEIIKSGERLVKNNPITLDREEDGSIKLEYVELVTKNVLYPVPELHVITISPMLMGDTMRMVAEKEDVKWFAETNGIPMNKSETYTQLGIGWATVLLQEGIGMLPIVGEVVDIIDQTGSSIDILNEVNSYEQMAKETEIKQMADNYRLNAIRVIHEEGVKSSLSYYVFEGIGDSEKTETTRQRIDNLNKNLSQGGDYEEYAKKIGYNPDDPITLEDILENSEKVIKLQDKWIEICGGNTNYGVPGLGSAGLYE